MYVNQIKRFIDISTVEVRDNPSLNISTGSQYYRYQSRRKNTVNNKGLFGKLVMDSV